MISWYNVSYVNSNDIDSNKDNKPNNVDIDVNIDSDTSSSSNSNHDNIEHDNKLQHADIDVKSFDVDIDSDTNSSNISSKNDISSYYHEEYNNYPKHIPIYLIRRDEYTNQIVSRNRLSLLGGLINVDDGVSSSTTKVSLAEFKKILQCPKFEPELLGKRGSLSLYKLLPITRRMIINVCAFLQTGCNPWYKCLTGVRKKNGKRLYYEGEMVGSPYRAKLYRIINNQLFFDWPWGQYQHSDIPISMIKPIIAILLRVSDIGNSTFLMGEEVSFLPYNIPFPAFTNAPKLLSSEMPWPWIEALSHAENEIKSNYVGINETNDWNNRIPKAVFYGTLTGIRQIFFDAATKRPDLIEARWTTGEDVSPWNPESTELPFEFNDKRYNNDILEEDPSSAGTLKNLLKLQISEPKVYDADKFKYAVVLSGLDGTSASGRLSKLLGSGAVILLQENEFAYTFSSYLERWVHYVPLSVTAADIIDKIEYLKANDHLAARLASNAKNFARSHLRLEDYFCYVATALQSVSNITSRTDANIPFQPHKIIIPDGTY